jgi:DnaJ-class molecular chaperone
MTKLYPRLIEKRCTACNGTGHLEVLKPVKPTVRIYPPQCKVCGGRGRISENVA